MPSFTFGCSFDFYKKLWYNKKKDFFTDRPQSFTSFGGAYGDLIYNRSAPGGGGGFTGKYAAYEGRQKQRKFCIWGVLGLKFGLSRWCAGRSTFG